MITRTFISLFLFIFSCNCLTFSQEIGQILTKQEADNLFGQVYESQSINTEVLSGLLMKTEKHIMFRLVNGSLIILGDNRSPLFPPGAAADLSESFHLFSRNKLVELINRGGAPEVYAEKRENVLTLTCGGVTLEFSIPCPPYCS